MLKLVNVLSASHFPARILPLAFKPETAEMSLRCNISWLIKSCWQQQKNLNKTPCDWLSRLHEMKEVHWLVPEQHQHSAQGQRFFLKRIIQCSVLWPKLLTEATNARQTKKKTKKNDCSTYYLIINPVFKPSIQKILQICSGWHPWTYNGNQEHFQHSLCQSTESIPSIIKTLD